MSKQQVRFHAGKHFLTSKTLVLEDERQADFDELAAQMVEQYQPESPMDWQTVEEGARAIWMLRRTCRRFDAEEQALYAQQHDFALWTAEQRHRLELNTRYRTSYERGFTRALRNLEHLSKSAGEAAERAEESGFRHWRETQKLEFVSRKSTALAQRAEAQTAAVRQAMEIRAEKRAREKAEEERTDREREQPARREEKKGPVLPREIRQHLDIRVVDGKLEQSAYPSNDAIRIATATYEPTGLVRRIFDFPGGVPAEYKWAVTAEGRQPMKVAVWRRVAEREHRQWRGLFENPADLPAEGDG
jgi:hypothetical protein